MENSDSNSDIDKVGVRQFPFLSPINSHLWPTDSWYSYGFRSGAFNYAPQTMIIPTLPVGAMPPPHMGLSLQSMFASAQSGQIRNRAASKSDSDMGSDDTPRKKRIRQPNLTKSQIRQLEESFQRCKYPSMKQRMGLSELLSITSRRVTVWFQNRRSKERKTVEEEVTASMVSRVCSTTGEVNAVTHNDIIKDQHTICDASLGVSNIAIHNNNAAHKNVAREEVVSSSTSEVN